jgi:V8-like Glu-specific endopeptidase
VRNLGLNPRTWITVGGAALLLILGGVQAAEAKPPPAAGPGVVSSTARTIDGQTIDNAAADAAVTAYWTPERMRNAKPLDAPATGTHDDQRSGKSDGPRGSIQPAAPTVRTLDVGTQLVDSQTVGKVFLHDPFTNTDGQCSGSAVNSGKKRLVMTVGHCVHGGPGRQWMTNWTFAPRYRNGVNPAYGLWSARQLTALNTWTANGNYDNDMGIAIMNTNGSGQRIVDVLGGNGLRWNWGYNVAVTDLGYPCNAPFSCQIQYFCSGNTKYAGHGEQVELYCDFKGGASGAPWLMEYNDQNGIGYINSLDSHDHGVPHADNGPYFDNDIKILFDYAESLSP